MPIVYLIQPCELIGTDRYKIGRSAKNDLSRMKGYKNGTRYISIMEVENDKHVERNLINHFNNTYKKIAGNEYFQGNESDMLKDFLDIVINKKEINYKLIKEPDPIYEPEQLDKHNTNINYKNIWMNKYSYHKI